jgi:uncharacterized membrane protein YgcG
METIQIALIVVGIFAALIVGLWLMNKIAGDSPATASTPTPRKKIRVPVKGRHTAFRTGIPEYVEIYDGDDLIEFFMDWVLLYDLAIGDILFDDGRGFSYIGEDEHGRTNVIQDPTGGNEVVEELIDNPSEPPIEEQPHTPSGPDPVDNLRDVLGSSGGGSGAYGGSSSYGGGGYSGGSSSDSGSDYSGGDDGGD